MVSERGLIGASATALPAGAAGAPAAASPASEPKPVTGDARPIPPEERPGLSHQVGHGIGLDGREPAYFVGGDTGPLQVGMCFADEPGIHIPGELGVRLENRRHTTEQRPKLFSGLAKSLEAPI